MADAVLIGSSANVAFTITLAGLGTLDGALYSPVAEIVPQAASVHPIPLTLQSTRLSASSLEVTENCCEAPAGSFTIIFIAGDADCLLGVIDDYCRETPRDPRSLTR